MRCTAHNRVKNCHGQGRHGSASKVQSNAKQRYPDEVIDQQEGAIDYPAHESDGTAEIVLAALHERNEPLLHDLHCSHCKVISLQLVAMSVNCAF